MMKNTLFFYSRLLFFTGILLFVFQSCVKDNFDLDKLSDQVEMKPSFSLALAKGSLTIADLIEPDDSLIFFDPDNSIRLVSREDSIFSVEMSEFVEIPEQATTTKILNYEPVSIDDFDVTSSITLGDIVEELNEPEKSILESYENSSEVFPGIPPQNAGSYFFEGLPDIDWVEFSEGDLIIQVVNNLPVLLSSLEITVYNETDNSVVGSFSFSNVDSGEMASQTIDMSGIILHDQLRIEITEISSPGSSEEVYIDFSDNIQITAVGENVKVLRGRAVLPHYVVDSSEELYELEVDGDERITVLELAEAGIGYHIEGEMFDGVFIELVLPETKRDDIPIELLVELVEGSPYIEGSVDLGGTRSDLSTDPDKPYNHFAVEYNFYVNSDGNMVDFDFSYGGLEIDYSINNIEIEYIEGYFGMHEVILDEDEFDLGSDLDFLDDFTGEFKFTDPRVRLIYENSFGLPLELDINMTGESGDSEPTHLNPPLISFIAATDTTAAYSGDFEINRDNSNIVDFIGDRPQLIHFSGKVTANPGSGDPPDMSNFASRNSSITVGLEAELPLEVQISDFGLSDTTDLDVDAEDIDLIENAVLYLSALNGFPLSLALDLVLHNSQTGTDLYSFDEIVVMSAAPVDAAGIVQDGQTVSSAAEIEMSREVLDHFAEADKLIITFKLNTSDGGEVPVKFLTTYSVDFNLRIKSNFVIR